MSSEDELIRWLRRRARGAGAEAIGDDAAAVTGDGRWAVTMDTQIEGVHFLPSLPPERLARRLLAVNLSDLAAVGAEPAWALLALAAPRGYPHRAFFRALLTACRRHRVRLVGGDLATTDRLTAVLTLAGTVTGGKQWVGRRGARPGDRLWIGGPLGESALGRLLLGRGARWPEPGGEDAIELPADLALPPPLAAAARRAVRRHLEPRPQLELGDWLARQDRAAALDVSDGLALDLARLCRESSPRDGQGAEGDPSRFLGAWIDDDALALTPENAELARRLGEDPRELCLSGGEDYVLLFALPPGVEPPGTLEAESPAGAPRDGAPAAAAEPGCRRIGAITAPSAGARDVVLELDEKGRRSRLTPRGWDHLGKPAPSGPPPRESSE